MSNCIKVCLNKTYFAFILRKSLASLRYADFAHRHKRFVRDKKHGKSC